MLLPTATEDALGKDQWGAGPTAVGLYSKGGWTYGALTNHIWSSDEGSAASETSATFFQPFLNYTTPDAWSYILNSETTYDWEGDQWSVPINALVTWAESPDAGPDGWGIRLQLTFLFPK